MPTPSEPHPSASPSAAAEEEQRREKRRAIKRLAQQRSRAEKQSLIQRLQHENEQLKARLYGRRSLAGSSSSSSVPAEQSSGAPERAGSQSSSLSPPFPTPTSSTPPGNTGAPSAVSVDLSALNQAFLAVLASVCDPHLNTIHAICQKFAQSRRGRAGPDLHAPRPVNRPLNTHHIPHTHTDNYDIFEQFLAATFDTIDPAAYIPPLGAAGPLSVPFLEPPHPIDGYELDAHGVWSYVVAHVDLSRTDAEDLASRLTSKIRCYGFGPVLLRHEVQSVCREFPALPSILST